MNESAVGWVFAFIVWLILMIVFNGDDFTNHKQSVSTCVYAARGGVVCGDKVTY